MSQRIKIKKWLMGLLCVLQFVPIGIMQGSLSVKFQIIQYCLDTEVQVVNVPNFCVGKNTVRKINSQTGEELWSFDFPESNQAIRLDFSEHQVFVYAWDFPVIYALDQQTGNLVWKYALDIDQHYNSYSGGRVFLIQFNAAKSIRSSWFALNASDGTLLWKLENIEEYHHSFRVVGDIVVSKYSYPTTAFDGVLFRDLKTGKEIWRVGETRFGWEYPFFINEKFVYTKLTHPTQGLTRINQRDLKTGQILAECDIEPMVSVLPTYSLELTFGSLQDSLGLLYQKVCSQH
jgi:glucose dehydrogenase